jgi:excisionase family DNA binding protein
MNESFLTTDEVLEYLQVNLRTVYRLIKAGKIPAVRVGRQWRFRKSDIDAWLASQQTGAVPPPPAPTEAEAQPTAVTNLPRNGRPKVLVVDDEASIRDLLSRALALADYDVDVVASGQAALERMRHSGYSLLITDLKMPGLDGLSVITAARRVDSKLPVIVITGYSSESSAIEAANIGVSGYLTKPSRRCSSSHPFENHSAPASCSVTPAGRSDPVTASGCAARMVRARRLCCG